MTFIQDNCCDQWFNRSDIQPPCPCCSASVSAVQQCLECGRACKCKEYISMCMLNYTRHNRCNNNHDYVHKCTARQEHSQCPTGAQAPAPTDKIKFTRDDRNVVSFFCRGQYVRFASRGSTGHSEFKISLCIFYSILWFFIIFYLAAQRYSTIIVFFSAYQPFQKGLMLSYFGNHYQHLKMI